MTHPLRPQIKSKKQLLTLSQLNREQLARIVPITPLYRVSHVDDRNLLNVPSSFTEFLDTGLTICERLEDPLNSGFYAAARRLANLLVSPTNHKSRRIRISVLECRLIRFPFLHSFTDLFDLVIRQSRQILATESRPIRIQPNQVTLTVLQPLRCLPLRHPHRVIDDFKNIWIQSKRAKNAVPVTRQRNSKRSCG